MSIYHAIRLLEVCLRNTPFLFQGKYYEQVPGAAMGSPISPTVVNLFIEGFKTKAINITDNPPGLWRKYVDHTFVIQKIEDRP